MPRTPSSPDGLANLPAFDPLSAVVQSVAEISHLLLFLDYDGTLVPFAARPEDAKPDEQLLLLLAELARRPRTEVQIVSGRDRMTLQQWLGHLPLAMHAEHGFWSRSGAGLWQAVMPPNPAWKPAVHALLEPVVHRIAGSQIEEKSSGLVWHYRQACDTSAASAAARELADSLRRVQADYAIEVLEGNHVVEIHTPGINKGIIVRQQAAQHDAPWRAVAIGDDRTDETMFAALPSGGVSIHVGSTPTQARFRLPSPLEVRGLLRALVKPANP